MATGMRQRFAGYVHGELSSCDRCSVFILSFLLVFFVYAYYSLLRPTQLSILNSEREIKTMQPASWVIGSWGQRDAIFAQTAANF